MFPPYVKKWRWLEFISFKNSDKIIIKVVHTTATLYSESCEIILFYLPNFICFKIDIGLFQSMLFYHQCKVLHIMFYLYAANPWCLTDGSLHNAGASYLYSDSGWDQGDHWGLCECSAEWSTELPLNCPDYGLITLEKCILWNAVDIFPMNNADEMSRVVFLQKRHKADNTVNKKKTTGRVLLSYLCNRVRNDLG